jgi:flagellar capping protein FliD
VLTIDNIAQLSQSVNYYNTFGVNSTQPTNNSANSSGLDAAIKRIGQQQSSTNVQLSAFGKIKSGFAGLQTAGTALSKASNSATATAADLSNAAHTFVNAYNTTATAISSATKSTGALANDNKANSAGNDLSRTLASGSNISDLKAIGISTNNDGTLTFDSVKFNAALASNSSATKSTLTSFSSQAVATSTKELSGNVGSSVNTLTTRAQTLDTQQRTLKNIASSTDAQQLGSYVYNSARGIAAYNSIFSL